MYEQTPADGATRGVALSSPGAGATGTWQVGGGYESIDNNNTSADYETLPDGNIAHDYEALEDRSAASPSTYEVMQGGGSVDVLYSTTTGNGDITFGAKQGAPGNVV